MPIFTDQGPALDNKYMPLLQFLSQGMKDREAVEVLYKIRWALDSVEDNDRLVHLIEELR